MISNSGPWLSSTVTVVVHVLEFPARSLVVPVYIAHYSRFGITSTKNYYFHILIVFVSFPYSVYDVCVYDYDFFFIYCCKRFSGNCSMIEKVLNPRKFAGLANTFCKINGVSGLVPEY